jgi:hypothetical protein
MGLAIKVAINGLDGSGGSFIGTHSTIASVVAVNIPNRPPAK